jgi:N-acetyl-anhydromuramyl-L-alanine amidase AmpD
MNSALKQLTKKHKYWLIGLTLLLVLVLIVATSKPIRIIDKYNILMRSSSKKYATRTLNRINQIVVHHSASIGQRAEDYARYHVQSKGWAGIGYHLVIEVNGDIIGCNPLTNISYGVAGHNTRSINICLSGDFTKQDPSPQQLRSLELLIKHLRSEFPQTLAVAGHKDYGQTSCPGPKLYQHLKKFQAA